LTEKLFCFIGRQVVPSSFRSQLITERYYFFSEANIRPRWFLENLVRNVLLVE
jgi:hypothetical protein